MLLAVRGGIQARCCQEEGPASYLETLEQRVSHPREGSLKANVVFSPTALSVLLRILVASKGSNLSSRAPLGVQGSCLKTPSCLRFCSTRKLALQAAGDRPLGEHTIR